MLCRIPNPAASDSYTNPSFFIFASFQGTSTCKSGSSTLYGCASIVCYMKKIKLNIIKISQIPFSGLKLLPTDLWDLFVTYLIVEICGDVDPKINCLVCKNAATRVQAEVAACSGYRLVSAGFARLNVFFFR